jgi:hypothetical protein
LSVGGGADYGHDPNLSPLAVLDSMNAGDTGAVIDSVSLTGGRYPAPHVTAIRGDHSMRWFPANPRWR